uniref:Uncharacterized protein n=1 Tax=Arundo donax TaxID=35708 RepID=A0A0A9CI09_ARUDO
MWTSFTCSLDCCHLGFLECETLQVTYLYVKLICWF